MFFGSFRYALDDKGRLVIPAKLRAECGLTLFALRGFEHCLSLYPAKNFESLVAQLKQMDFMQPENRPFVRLALASVIELTIDDHGRIQLPVETQQHYGFQKNMTILGVQDHLEIWDTDAWTAYEKQAQAGFDTFNPSGVKK